MKLADILALLGVLFGAGGVGTGLFFRKKYQAGVRKENADARKSEVDAEKGEVEIRRLDTETARLFREEFSATVKEFREERRQIAAERAAEREQFKAERDAERAVHRELTARKEAEWTAEIEKWTRKLDDAIAAHEADRRAWKTREAELLALVQKSDERQRAIKNSLQGIEEQMKLEAEIQTRRQRSIEEQLKVLWQAVEEKKGNGPPSKEPLTEGAQE